MSSDLLAGSFLSASFDKLFDMIISGVVRGKKLDDGMRKKFKILLLAVNAVLNDAEKKQISDPHVRQWLDELKDTMYSAEDLALEMEITENDLRCKEKDQSRKRKFQRVFQSISSIFHTDHNNLEDRIEQIISTLQCLVDQKDLLHLSTSQGVVHQNRSSSSSSPELLPVEEESDIYGRDKDKEHIVNLLLPDDADQVVGDNKICVIPIVGMGGIGKTTLARLVYNDVNVMKNFDLKAWVTVSNEFDVFTLTKTIFERITEQNDCGIKHPDQLQTELKKVVEGKKFLFVLDDIWNEKYNLWDKLRSQFRFGASGSKIIVTTRNESIGSMMGTVSNHCLGILSDEDSWQLFAKHAFQKVTDPSAVQEFEEIGRGIVDECKGLPLAIISLGGLLCSKNHIDEWKEILNSDIWKLECNIIPALWLSYQYLPPHLKRCFAYCSIFPKDFEFEKETLILLWMAEDLLPPPQQNTTLEEIGEKYFNDLTSRSFFQRGEDIISYTNIRFTFTMHDLVNDLATLVSGEFCSRLDDGSSKDFTGKTRHLSCMTSEIDDMKKLEEYFSKNKVLRTLLFPEQDLINLEQYLKPMRCLRVLSLRGSPIRTGLDLIGSLKLLKYLDLSETRIEELPDTICTLYNLQTLLLNKCEDLYRLSCSIGNLKHLRYLDLSKCYKIKEVPDTLCDLKDLRTLNLVSCYSLCCLPTDMSRLVNLRYLDFSDTRVREMPPRMCELTHLQHLSPLIIDKNGGRNIEDLGNLQDLRGSLRIKNIENIVNVGDVWEAKLKDKKHITHLQLEWCGETDDSEKAREVLERLQPRTNVQYLTITNYQGTSFPSWIGHHSFCHIVSVYLYDCKNCYLLPPLGQLPSLKKLSIWGLEKMERIGDEFYSYSCSSNSTSTSTSSGSSSMINTPVPVPVPFKSLESLHLSGLRELREWKEWSLMKMMGGGHEEGTGAFPQLKRLHLSSCPKIKGDCFPCNLPSSTTLVILRECQRLVASLQSHQLPWLGELHLQHCSDLVSFPPQGGLPSNIHTIRIGYCDKLESLAKQGWPSNLKLLDMWNCYKLRCLPEEGLPDSLCELNIRRCHPSLADRCQRDTGEDWPKIAHIPRIHITAAIEESMIELQSLPNPRGRRLPTPNQRALLPPPRSRFPLSVHAIHLHAFSFLPRQCYTPCKS